jgi:Right handed beta helix region
MPKMSRQMHNNFLMIVSLSCTLFATSYYVSSDGNDSYAGTNERPFKSIATAIGKAAAGDSIIIASGTYNYSSAIKITSSGIPSKFIYLIGSGLGTSRPVLDFSSMSLAGGNQGIILSGNYWYIKGLIIKGAGDNGLLVQGGSNNTIEFCDFIENRDSGCQLKGGAANNRIINCDSYNNRDPDEGDADGFAPKMDVGSGNTFIGCRAWNNSDDGWDGYLRGTDNINTKLENCWCFHNGYRKDGSASTGNGNGFKMGGSDEKDLKHNFTLIRCFSFSNRVKGFDQNNNRGAMTLYNCTGFNNGINYAIDGSSSTLIVKNSISSGTGSNALKGGTQSSNNMNVASSQFVSIDPASASSPRKADGSLPEITFLHLTKSSSLIDAGEVITNVTYQGSKPDLGCFEFEIPTLVHSVTMQKNAAIMTENPAMNILLRYGKNRINTNNSLFSINGRIYTAQTAANLTSSAVFLSVNKLDMMNK